MARTKIVATLGPSTKDVRTIKELIRLGVDVFRINFSHGNRKNLEELIQNARKAAGNTPIALMGDLTGPKLRCGTIPGEPIFLKKGDRFVLTARNIKGTEKGVSVNYKGLPVEAKIGDHIYLDDGKIELRVVRIRDHDIFCRIEAGGELVSNKGMNLPHTNLSIPALTRKDRDMIRFGIQKGLDFFALSFVKSAKDIKQAKQYIRRMGSEVPIIAKIEKHEAVKNLAEIVEEADGAMVARGDLGIEIPMEEVPVIQKRIIRLCNERGKPVITATQMMETMIQNPRPTRAEVADIANAIIDGTDAVMLSGETAIGKYPARTVNIMDTVAKNIEETLDYNEKLAGRTLTEAGSVPDAISLATCHIARTLDVAAILCCSATGYTARFVARYRPKCPILVFTPHPKTKRRLNLTWGVIPILLKKMKGKNNISGFDAIIKQAVKIAEKKGCVKKGDQVVITAGLPLGIDKTTNMLRVINV